MVQNNLLNKRVAFCMVCGECLGEYRLNCAEEHTKKYPSHNDFMVRKIIDPLLLIDPDLWFKKRSIIPDRYALSDAFFHEELPDGDSPEPFQGFCIIQIA